MASPQRVEIPGSQREHLQHPRVGEADSGKQIEVTVYLRPSASLNWVDEEVARAPAERRTISREKLASDYGVSDEDIAAVRSFAKEYGLEVTAVDKGRRTVSLRGTVKAVAVAFGAQDVGLFNHPTEGAYRARRGPLTVPRELGDVITGVFGIDERPQARPTVAPGAKIVVYFSNNSSDQGFLDAVSIAVHDTTHNPSVVSISWGGPEDSWTQQARAQMEQILIEAAAVGVTVTVASGDNGSSDGVNDGKQHVDFPASAPHALACGGTRLQINHGQITNEAVWNDAPGGGAGGGGISIEFAVPSYQNGIQTKKNVDTGQPGRGVPDVAGDADPETGYSIVVDGEQETIGGTSAVAPLWAGLTALINESLGQPVGFLQPQLYAGSAQGGFHDITEGNNGAYEAGPGWDPCTGLGSPNGTALLQALGGRVPVAATQ